MEQVTEIEKKKYLGRRDLTEMIVPAGVDLIGEYAFAQCQNLNRVALPKGAKLASANCFFECDRLTHVYVYETGEEETIFAFATKKAQAVAYFFASAIRFFPEASLLDVEKVGDDQWMNRWDVAFSSYITAPDDVGFSPFLAGGEEDYEDPMNDIDYYCRHIRMRKTSLIVGRLLDEVHFPILDEARKNYVSYLRDHDETFAVLSEAKSRLPEMVELFRNEGWLTDQKTEELLTTLPDDAVELRSLLMQGAKKDIFSEFVL